MKLITIVLIVLLNMNFMFCQQFIDLGGTWHFKTDLYEKGIAEKWFEITSFKHWDSLNVPANWDTENEYAYYMGTAWYQKNIVIEKNNDKSYYLQCESIYNESNIYINGTFVGENNAGFLPFEFDISKYLKSGSNTIVIRVNNSFKRGAIWNWGGIRRPLKIEICDKVRLNKHHIISNLNLKKNSSDVLVKLSIENSATTDKNIYVKHIIFRNGKTISEKSEKTKLNAQSRTALQFNSKIKDADLWHFNHPNLYTSVIKIIEKGKPIYTSEENFGIRKLEVQGTSLLLNGKKIKPVGFNLIPDDRIYGNSYPDHRIKEDVKLLKELGCQMARLSHLPLPKAFLDELDKQGIMTFEEVSLWGKDKMVDPENPVPFSWLRRMIDEKHNHPSIVGWSIGNEIGFQDMNPKAMAYVKKAIDSAHVLDPNRLAFYVTHSASEQDEDPVIYSDLIMFNRYNNFGKDADIVHNKYPNKPIFFSEFGRQLNSEDPNNSLIPISDIYKEMRQRPFVVGASMWTFNDYRSTWVASDTWTTPPSENRAWGIVTTFREKKKQFSEFQKEHLPFTFEYDLNKSTGKLTLNTFLRPPTSFPYYDCSDYQINISTLNSSKILSNQSIFKIKDKIDLHLNLKNEETVQIQFKDPQNNIVYNEHIFLTVPKKPKLLKIHTAEKSIRLIYSKVDNATHYIAELKNSNGTTIQSISTINDFIDITGLNIGKTYDATLKAVNEMGTTAVEVKHIKTDEDELPPIIWSVKSIDSAAMISFSVDEKDLSFQFRYGTQPGKYDHQFELRNFGVVKIPNLKNGETYYLQMNRRRQWGFESEWSHEITLKPITIK